MRQVVPLVFALPFLIPPVPAIAASGYPQLIIETPADGALLPGNEQRRITARFEPPVDFEVLGLEATIEAIGPGGTVELARGDLRHRDAPDRIGTIWSLEDFGPGDYRLRVTARAGKLEGSAEVAVRVRPPPEVALYLTSLRKAKDGIEATFETVAESPAGSPIVQYVFDPGTEDDLQASDNPHFVARFPALGTSYTISVEARDDTGTSSYIARELHVPLDWPVEVPYEVSHLPFGSLVPREGYAYPPVPQEKVLKKPADCGCQQMTIIGGGRVAQSRPLCAPADLEREIQKELLNLGCLAVQNPAADACPPGELPFTCPIGQRPPSKPGQQPVNFRLGWGFEVFSELDPPARKGSQCTHGQYIRVEQRRNGMPMRRNKVAQAFPDEDIDGKVTFPADIGADLTVSVVKAPDRVPRRTEPGFGADDFAGQDLLVRRSPTSIYWYDQPFFTVFDIRLPVVQTAQNDLEFISFVRGVNGQPTCWCRFTLKQDYVAGGGEEAGNQIVIIDGNTRCAPGPGVLIDI